MISPLAHVDPSAKLGKDVTIHAFAYIDADTELGDGCEIMPYASVIRGTVLGKGVKVYQGAIVGADPQDFRWQGGESKCVIGDRTIIREHVIINRGFLTESGTTVGEDCFIFANSHIGHDSHLAAHCVLGNNVSVAGQVSIEIGSILSSAVVIHEGVCIGRCVLIKGGTRISSNVPPYVIMAHNPVRFYGTNAVILQKHAGFTEQQIDDITKAYRHIYQTQTSLFNALKRIEADIEDSPIRNNIIDFIRSHNMQIAGEHFDAE